MATKLKADEPRKLPSGKYDKSDDRYYAWIGRKGGKRTAKVQPKGYFSGIARLRHNSVDDSTGTSPAEAESNRSPRPRKPAGGRAK